MAAFLHLGFRKVVFEDMHKLTDIIEDPMPNHISTMDDPLIWGAMPKHMRWNPEHMRWTLGAKELLYKNPVLNMFFAYGQTIPTIRGAGIHQLAMEIALRRLRENRWVHVFPEGKVNQDDHLIRLKWGVGRLIMESDRVPIVVPMFHHGMKEVMPLRQKVPMPYPNPWKSVFYLKIGDAVDFTQQVSEWKAMREKLTDPVEIADLDEKVRVQITARVWAAMDELKTMAEAAIGDGRLDT
ncbi:Lyso-phosphatidylcholine acyltransferase [Linderina macrospora]|uniref:Lyso-phosphatidylcholine acyltransferase n=1 Tax=Linderina macrospora TaxID=4868 RepID=A0ACC1J8G0_9FUNG|nr:Lyso-phosphatidylcholine acyltransferase [Linderina macrospora]